MRWKGFLALLTTYILYLVAGGYWFKYLEQPARCTVPSVHLKNSTLQTKLVKQLLTDLKGRLNESERLSLEGILEDAGRLLEIRHGSLQRSKRSALQVDEDVKESTTKHKPGANVTASASDDDLVDQLLQEDDAECQKWNFYNSFFFAFTAITTIGYGNQAPVTRDGRLVCIFYSLFGIPINGLLIATIAGFFTTQFKRFRQNRPQESSPKNPNSFGRKVLLGFHVFAYLIPGIALFIMLPSVAFFHLEDKWTFVDCIYFSFITLSTVGFGDLVAGRDLNEGQLSDSLKIVYEACIIVWIIFGLGYIFMLINLVAEAYTSSVKIAKKSLLPQDKQLISTVLSEVLNRRLARAGPRGPDPNADGDLVDSGDIWQLHPDFGNGDAASVDHLMEGVDLDAVNDATMTSFYQFLATAVRGAPPSGDQGDNTAGASNLLTVDYGSRRRPSRNGGPQQPCFSAPGSRKVSTATNASFSPDLNYQTVSAAGPLGTLQEEGSEVGQPSRHLGVGPASNNLTTTTLPDFLKDVTLEELLQAADAVRERQ